MRSALLPALAAVLVAPAARAQIRVPVQKKVLPNGLTVLLVERHDAPVFSARIGFRVGSSDEVTGITGTAHLLEHMLFKGTRSIGLKNPADADKEQGLLEKEDGLWDAILAEQRALAEASAKSVYATGKAGPATSPRLEQLQKDFAAVQAEHQALIEPNALGAVYRDAGVRGLNAGTSYDTTVYQVSLPKNRFELWCRVESDRMNAPVLREFYAERDVVKEERRMRFDDGNPSPDWVLWETFYGTAFIDHPYGRPLPGTMSDLYHLKRTEVQDFYTKYYAPNRAALVLVGDLTWKDIEPAIDAYFGKLRRQPDPLPVHTTEMEQQGERRSVVEKDMTPMIRVGWHVPAMDHPDAPALNVLASLLASGRTSRLYRAAVDGKQVAASFHAASGVPGGKYPGLFCAWATAKGDHGTQELEAVLYGEVEKLKQAPPTQAELDRVLRRDEMDMVSKLEDADSLADELASTWAVTGDENAFTLALDREKEVTPADVQRVAKAYLTDRNRVVTTLVRTGAPAAAQDPLDAEIEGLLTKAVAAQVPDAEKVKQIMAQQMGMIRSLPKEKKQQILEQLKQQVGK